MAQTDNIPPLDNGKHAAVIEALLSSGGSVPAAAKVSGVSVRTIYRYLDDPVFTLQLQGARGQALGASVSRLAMSTGAAVDTLESIATNKKASPGVRVQASQAILAHAAKHIEQLDVLTRLEKLESQNGKP